MAIYSFGLAQRFKRLSWPKWLLCTFVPKARLFYLAGRDPISLEVCEFPKSAEASFFVVRPNRLLLICAYSWFASRSLVYEVDALSKAATSWASIIITDHLLYIVD